MGLGGLAEKGNTKTNITMEGDQSYPSLPEFSKKAIFPFLFLFLFYIICSNEMASRAPLDGSVVYGAFVFEVAMITSFVLTVIVLDASAIGIDTLVVFVVGEVKLWGNVLGVVMLCGLAVGSIVFGMAGLHLMQTDVDAHRIIMRSSKGRGELVRDSRAVLRV